MSTETKPDMTIIYPKHCSVCTRNEVPAEERTVIVFEHEERCGTCGNNLGPTHSLSSSLYRIDSPAVRSVIRSLVQHGVFGIDFAFGSWNPVRLCRQDQESGAQITCHINYSFVCRAIRDSAIRRYDRGSIGCALPTCVRTACELLSALTLQGRHLTFDSADVRRERKTLRFGWEVPVVRTAQGNPAHEHLLIEIAWTVSDDDASLLPTPAQAEQAAISAGLAEEELRIAADVAALRLAAVQAMGNGVAHKGIPLYTVTSSSQEYRRHPAAIRQVIAELDTRGWCACPTGPELATSLYLILILEKKLVV